MTCVQRRNRLTTHFSERNPVVKRRRNVNCYAILATLEATTNLYTGRSVWERIQLNSCKKCNLSSYCFILGAYGLQHLASNPSTCTPEYTPPSRTRHTLFSGYQLFQNAIHHSWCGMHEIRRDISP